jgi:hypothetical protein
MSRPGEGRTRLSHMSHIKDMGQWDSNQGGLSRASQAVMGQPWDSGTGTVLSR